MMLWLFLIFITFCQAIVIDKTLNGLDQYDPKVIKHIRQNLIEAPPKKPEDVEGMDFTSFLDSGEPYYDYHALHGKTYIFYAG